MSAAQFMALVGSPLPLAPGRAGCIIDIKSIVIEFTPGTIPFSGGNGNLSISTGSTFALGLVGYAGAIIQVVDFHNVTESLVVWGSPWWIGPGSSGSQQSATPLSDVEGFGITLNNNNGTNPTQGNGTFKIYLEYSYIVA
jgi:hypothetical protein